MGKNKGRRKRKGCDGKFRHARMGAAIGAANNLNRRRLNRLMAYGCRHCGGFHIGHPTKKMRNAMRRKKY